MEAGPRALDRDRLHQAGRRLVEARELQRECAADAHVDAEFRAGLLLGLEIRAEYILHTQPVARRGRRVRPADRATICPAHLYRRGTERADERRAHRGQRRPLPGAIRSAFVLEPKRSVQQQPPERVDVRLRGQAGVRAGFFDHHAFRRRKRYRG